MDFRIDKSLQYNLEVLEKISANTMPKMECRVDIPTSGVEFFDVPDYRWEPGLRFTVNRPTFEVRLDWKPADYEFFGDSRCADVTYQPSTNKDFGFYTNVKDDENLFLIIVPYEYTRVNQYSLEEITDLITERFGFSGWQELDLDSFKPKYINEFGEDLISRGPFPGVFAKCAVKAESMLCINERRENGSSRAGDIYLMDYPPFYFEAEAKSLNF